MESNGGEQKNGADVDSLGHHDHNHVEPVFGDLVACSSGLERVKGKKRVRIGFSSHPECVRCTQRKKKDPTHTPSAWSQFLKKYRLENPGLGSGQSLVEARKRYVPPSGRRKSYEVIFREVWQAKNPNWKEEFSKTDLKDKLRSEFLNAI